MSEAWLAFARHGDPATAALPAWPTYEPVRRATMYLGAHCRVVEDPDPVIRNLWATV